MIRIGSIKKGETIKCGHDTYLVLDPTPKYDAEGECPRFSAVRFIKTKQRYGKQVKSLRFDGLAEKGNRGQS